MVPNRATHHSFPDNVLISSNEKCLTLWAPISQNVQIHSNNSSAIADKLFECFTILWGWHLKGYDAIWWFKGYNSYQLYRRANFL